MRKKAVAPVEPKLTPEQRMDIDHIATAMYAERVLGDTEKGKSLVYETNPDARQLYFKGVSDTLSSLETWSQMNIPTELMEKFINALRSQTADDAVTH